MKRIFLFFALLAICTFASAYDYEYAGCYKSVKLTYQSMDENNQPITLSEMVTLPLEKDGQTNREVGFFVLTSMPYTSDLFRNSSGEQPMDALFLRSIATEGAMVVQVDGQGFGDSEGHTIPYLANKVNARQAIDGLLAAMDYAQKDGIKVNTNYYTINAGYSLAGGVAIAIQRYLEKYSSQVDKARVRLRKTICGGAPINITATAKYVLNKARQSNGNDWRIRLLKGCVEAYKNSTLHAVDMNEIFENDSTLNLWTMDSDNAECRALWKVIKNEDMDEDWVPETPVTMFHYADDDYVPYENTQIALKAWGNEKLHILDKDFSGKKWNVSLLKAVRENVNKYASLDSHLQGMVNFYSGMADGCLRDTLIANSYGKALNYEGILTTVFDLTSGLNVDLPVNITTPVKLQNTTVAIKTLGYLHCAGEVLDSLGNTAAVFDVTVKPEVKDELHSKIKCVDAKGYLHLPLDFKVVLPGAVLDKDLTITGSCQDGYKFVEQLTAIILHRNCPTREVAQKYCDAINSNLTASASFHLLWSWSISEITGELYFNSTLSSEGYTIEPYIKSSILFYSIDEPLVGFLKDKADMDITPYLTIDNQKMAIGDYTAMFHVTDRDFNGNLKMYADILTADSTVFARVDINLSPEDMNEEGTEETFNVNLLANIYSIHAQIVGNCQNLNDAALASILCYGNLSCQTEEEAQAYAQALNSNVQLEFYVENVGPDGDYNDYGYTDYGQVHAAVFQDDQGAYYVQYCLCWLDNKEVPLLTIINQLTK